MKLELYEKKRHWNTGCSSASQSAIVVPSQKISRRLSKECRGSYAGQEAHFIDLVVLLGRMAGQIQENGEVVRVKQK